MGSQKEHAIARGSTSCYENPVGSSKVAWDPKETTTVITRMIYTMPFELVLLAAVLTYFQFLKKKKNGLIFCTFQTSVKIYIDG
jgi:prolipoprotein diacylglyceryltransferase